MLKKILTYSVGAIGYSLISILVIPFLTRILNPTDYGKGNFFVTLLSLFFYISNIGLYQGYERFYFDINYKKRQNLLFFRCLSISLVVSVIIFTLLYMFKQSFISYFFGTYNISIYYAIVIGTISYLINVFFTLHLRMQQKAMIFSFIQILNGVIYFSFLLLFFLIDFTKSFYIIIYAQVCTLILVAFISGCYCLDLFSLITIKVRDLFNISEIKQIISYSYPFLFSFVMIWAMQYIDRIFIIKLSTFTELGIYSVSFTLVSPLIILQSAFLTLWAPLSMKILINYKYKGKLLHSFILKNITSLVFLGIVFIFCFKDLIPLFLGAKFQDSSKIFLWLLFIPLFSIVDLLLSAGINLSKKTYWNIWATLAGLAVNILCCIFMIPCLGAVGAAVALAIGNIIYITIKALSCRIYYKFHIDYLHIIITLILLSIAFVSLSQSNYSYISWVFIFLAFLYQIFIIFSQSNLRRFILFRKIIHQIGV
ncbi:lipopolysaccharide biosynthesis protein [Francisella tularensis]|uniref:lipopolysaccharide biosynthesis protein n=1 Tax=Francisella tularensis TaxID=263 RepID=UPI00018553E2|nr:lipopolysaccharide biosynthesis protein [Francisella tularensis]EDZ90859.1 membrane protein, putative [Francisella tularensis subsp. novicida FTG]MBK2335674.1 lipopolysaccharide biosynthesis protein [Francisella tularensis subsp. novicida]